MTGTSWILDGPRKIPVSQAWHGSVAESEGSGDVSVTLGGTGHHSTLSRPHLALYHGPIIMG